MSAFQIVNKPIEEIEKFLAIHNAEVKQIGDIKDMPEAPDMHIIKFNVETNISHPDINHLRGLVFNSKTGKIYSMTYPVPIEMKDLSSDDQKKIIDQIKTKPYTVEETLDGTLMRLAYIDEFNDWILSTNSKFDSHDAFWMHGVSFFDQFWSARPEIITDDLNKDYVYLFILCHPYNIIVVNHTKPEVYHVATYDRRTMKEVTPRLETKVPCPKKIDISVDEIVELITKSQDTPVASAGYMIIQPSDDGMVHRYRFENDNYTKARELRGESNNLNFFLLEKILDEDASKLSDTLKLYPIYKDDCVSLEKRISSLCALFYSEYGRRFKNREIIWVHHRHNRFLKDDIHVKLYIEKLKPMHKTVQYDDIMNYLRHLPPARLLFLLNYIYDN